MAGMKFVTESAPLDLHIVLVEPEIPQNTGNIARTCAALAVELHLAGPLGFSLADRYLKRAGLDYWGDVRLAVHDSFDGYRNRFPSRRLLFASRRGRFLYSDVSYPPGCSVVFGKESSGLPRSLLAENRSATIRIPMRSGIRSLNLSNAVAIIAYEAFRRGGFPGLDRRGAPL